MRYKILILIFVILYLFVGCQQKELSQKATIAKDYLEEQGYEILSYEEPLMSYTLTKKKLEDLPYQIYWSLPGNNPNPYFNKEVQIEKFIVKNHPLDDWECCDGIKSRGKVYVYVYIVEGTVVGGTSFPFLAKKDEVLGGGYWSLDGRSE